MGRAFHAGRLELVSNAMAQMLSHERIAELYAKEWGVTRRTVRRYITEMQRVWTERASSPQAIEERRSFFTETALVILRKQIGKGYDSAAMKTLDTLARWYGIGAPQVTTAIGIFNDRGAMTSQDAINTHVREIEAAQAEKVQHLAQQIAGQLAEQSAVTDEDDSDATALPAEDDDDDAVH